MCLTVSPPEAKEMDCMWWLAMICGGGLGHGPRGGLAWGPPAPLVHSRRQRFGRWQGRVPGDSPHLASGGDHEVQPVNGDVDSNAHASEAEVALAQDGEEGFVGSLTGGEDCGGDAAHQDQVSWGEEGKEGCPKRPQTLLCKPGRRPQHPVLQPRLTPGRSPGRDRLGGNSPSSSRCP